jgi:hypothetical protein
LRSGDSQAVQRPEVEGSEFHPDSRFKRETSFLEEIKSIKIGKDDLALVNNIQMQVMGS